MEHTRDHALILQIDKLNDHDAIVHLFTREHGLNRGVVKGGLSSKRRAELQIASLVDAQWKSRLPEHLSSLTVDGAVSFGARVMQDPLRLAAVGSAMGLLGTVLAERDPHPELFHRSVDFLRHVAAGVVPLIWLSEYVRLELALLAATGFGLDLTQCAATGAVDELIYVSPKSGRAVCRAAGAPYHARMLALPECVRNPAHLTDSFAEIHDGLALTGHFIASRMLPALHRKPPPIRTHFLTLVGRAGRESQNHGHDAAISTPPAPTISVRISSPAAALRNASVERQTSEV